MLLHAGTRGSGGMPPRKFLKKMLKYCKFETFPHKIHISAPVDILYTAFRL